MRRSVGRTRATGCSFSVRPSSSSSSSGGRSAGAILLLVQVLPMDADLHLLTLAPVATTRPRLSSTRRSCSTSGTASRISFGRRTHSTCPLPASCSPSSSAAASSTHRSSCIDPHCLRASRRARRPICEGRACDRRFTGRGASGRPNSSLQAGSRLTLSSAPFCASQRARVRRNGDRAPQPRRFELVHAHARQLVVGICGPTRRATKNTDEPFSTMRDLRFSLGYSYSSCLVILACRSSVARLPFSRRAALSPTGS